MTFRLSTVIVEITLGESSVHRVYQQGVEDERELRTSLPSIKGPPVTIIRLQFITSAVAIERNLTLPSCLKVISTNTSTTTSARTRSFSRATADVCALRRQVFVYAVLTVTEL